MQAHKKAPPPGRSGGVRRNLKVPERLWPRWGLFVEPPLLELIEGDYDSAQRKRFVRSQQKDRLNSLLPETPRRSSSRRSVLPLGAVEPLLRREMKYPAMKPAKTPVTNRRTSAIPLELLQDLPSL